MDGFNTPARLRSACDACHRLKRRCTGAMPCENCASIGASCLYSATSRLGRPPGSKSRRNTNGIKPPRTQRPRQSIEDRDRPTAKMTTNSDLEGLDIELAYDLTMYPAQTPNTAFNWFPTPETDIAHSLDALDTVDGSCNSHSTACTEPATPLSGLPTQFELPQLQEQAPGQHADPFQQRLHLSHHSLRHPPSSRGNPNSTCQCIPGFSALLHDLKCARDERQAPTTLDVMLARVSNTLAQSSAMATCRRCRGGDGDEGDGDDDDDDGESLLLAALTMRRTITQLIDVMNRREVSGGLDGAGREDMDTQVYVGAFQVIGTDRTTILRVLQTITVRKLDAAVALIQSVLRTKQARQGESDHVTLRHVEVILDGVAKSIRSLLHT